MVVIVRGDKSALEVDVEVDADKQGKMEDPDAGGPRGEGGANSDPGAWGCWVLPRMLWRGRVGTRRR